MKDKELIRIWLEAIYGGLGIVLLAALMIYIGGHIG